MNRYEFKVVVEAESAEHAVLVMASRIGPDEEIDDPRTGEPFNYNVNWVNGSPYDELMHACWIFDYEPGWCNNCGTQYDASYGHRCVDEEVTT